MKFLHCEKWFIFENNDHVYKTRDGITFLYQSHDGWQVVFNESLIELLRTEYEREVIG